MPQRPFVIVTRKLPDPVEQALAERFDAQLNREDHPFSSGELADALRSADGVLCTVTDRIDAAAFASGPLRARILANFGVGYNHIDVNAARSKGIVVTNTPGVLTEATADVAMALILMVARRLGEGERQLRAGQWQGWSPTHLMGADVSGRTLGIIGMGRIGKAVARRAAQGFGMEVLSYSRSGGSLEELLGRSDFVSLHVPATPETRHFMDSGRLGRMKRSAFLINTARGDVVDEAALIDALQRGTIAGAGLDVYEGEPRVPEALRQMENVVVLPHLGSATLSTRAAMGMKAFQNLEEFFRSGVAPDQVT